MIEELKIRNVNKDELKDINNEEYIVYDAVIKNNNNENKCFRCGNILTHQINYCSQCIELGKVRNDSYFLKKKLKSYKFPYSDRLNELKLANLQSKASKFILDNPNQNILIHAVCGAGKTEIVFASISKCLKENKFVCFAIPRIDILYEIAERLEYCFPKTKIAILNSKEPKDIDAQIYVMTTNQILNFKDCFSLIIVDEVDAYPYEHNSKFDYGVLSAKSSEGQIVYLTSTPSEKLLNQKLLLFEIYERWHQFDLPIPKYQYLDLKKLKKGYIPAILKAKLDQLTKENEKKSRKVLEIGKSQLTEANDKQLLLFVGNIKMGLNLSEVFKNNGYKIPFVSSKNEDRREIIEKFRDYKYNILLTTTILERGVTFNNIDVYVLDASNAIYNKASLIQIAGRVNRKEKYQRGEVIFFHEGKTKIMEEAKRQIILFNEKKNQRKEKLKFNLKNVIIKLVLKILKE